MSRRSVLPFLLCLATAAAGQEEAEVVDGLAAQVGGEIVLVSEVRQVAAPAEAKLREEGASEREIAMLQAEILERMIERALIRQVVKRAELEATDAEVDEAVATIARENGLDLAQIRESVESQGLPFDLYRERIRSEIEQSKVVNGMVASKVRVEEREVRALYEKRYQQQPAGGTELHLRHLLVPFDPEDARSRQRACDAVHAALARVAGGEPFEAVASEVSEVNPTSGGDLGWIHERELASWMPPALEGLAPGGVSEALETTFGCNALQLVERRAFEPLTYEQAREELRAQLFNERMAKEYAEFMEELRSRTFIERKGIYAEAARLDPDARGLEGGPAEF
jgi:peptidyl-prolyl cis-trans isomerase SurA